MRASPTLRSKHPALVLTTVLLLAALLAPSASRLAEAQAPLAQLRAFWVDNLNPGFYNHPQVDDWWKTSCVLAPIRSSCRPAVTATHGTIGLSSRGGLTRAWRLPTSLIPLNT